MKTKLLLGSSVALVGLSSFAVGGEYIAPPVSSGPAPSSTCAWTFEAAALYLKADSEDSSGYEDQDFEWAYRLGIAYDNGGCLGVRFRFFNFDGTNNSGSNDEQGPEIQSYDLEVFSGFALGSWQAQWSAGVRYLDRQEPYGGSYDVNYDGWGPTASIELTHPLTQALDFYVNARASFIFGDDDENEAADDTPVLEAGFGIQYNTVLFGNCESYVRLGVEGQRYKNLAYEYTDGDLYGGVLGFGLAF